jgi:hypothetical protein
MGHHFCRDSSAVDFKYDPKSYALNFEDEFRENEEIPFALRLPRSPERTTSVVVTEVVA